MTNLTREAPTMPDEAAPAPADPPAAELRNYGFETVAQCAARMRTEHERERKRIAIAGPVAGLGLTARECARLTAEGCAKAWRTVGQEQLATFYAAVAAALSED